MIYILISGKKKKKMRQEIEAVDVVVYIVAILYPSILESLLPLLSIVEGLVICNML